MAEFAKIPSFIWVPASSDAVKRILQDVPDWQNDEIIKLIHCDELKWFTLNLSHSRL
jgi:hypothetical protein